MTEREIRLVQESFHSVAPIADQVAAIFFARLFELDPSLRGLFSRGFAGQGPLFMQALGDAVQGLGRADRLEPTLRELGRRHAGYRVRAAHYDLAGVALLWALGRSLREAFTAEHHAAWTRFYAYVAATMQAGARESPAAPGPLSP